MSHLTWPACPGPRASVIYLAHPPRYQCPDANQGERHGQQGGEDAEGNLRDSPELSRSNRRQLQRGSGYQQQHAESGVGPILSEPMRPFVDVARIRSNVQGLGEHVRDAHAEHAPGEYDCTYNVTREPGDGEMRPRHDRARAYALPCRGRA